MWSWSDSFEDLGGNTAKYLQRERRTLVIKTCDCVSGGFSAFYLLQMHVAVFVGKAGVRRGLQLQRLDSVVVVVEVEGVRLAIGGLRAIDLKCILVRHQNTSGEVGEAVGRSCAGGDGNVLRAFLPCNQFSGCGALAEFVRRKSVVSVPTSGPTLYAAPFRIVAFRDRLPG